MLSDFCAWKEKHETSCVCRVSERACYSFFPSAYRVHLMQDAICRRKAHKTSHSSLLQAGATEAAACELTFISSLSISFLLWSCISHVEKIFFLSLFLLIQASMRPILIHSIHLECTQSYLRARVSLGVNCQPARCAGWVNVSEKWTLKTSFPGTKTQWLWHWCRGEEENKAHGKVDQSSSNTCNTVYLDVTWNCGARFKWNWFNWLWFVDEEYPDLPESEFSDTWGKEVDEIN